MSHEIDFGQIWYQKKDLEKLEVRRWFIKLADARARSYERFSSVSGVYLAFEFDSNPSEDRQQIHWRSSEAGKNWMAVFRRPLMKTFFSPVVSNPSEDRQWINWRSSEAGIKFIGGLPKGANNIIKSRTGFGRPPMNSLAVFRRIWIKFEVIINTADARKSLVTSCSCICRL